MIKVAGEKKNFNSTNYIFGGAISSIGDRLVMVGMGGRWVGD